LYVCESGYRQKILRQIAPIRPAVCHGYDARERPGPLEALEDHL